MAFLDDNGSAPDTKEPPDPEADARAAALTPERTAYLSMEIEGLSTQLVSRAIELGMTSHGFLLTMAHQWRVQRVRFDNARAAGVELGHRLAEMKKAAPTTATGSGANDIQFPAPGETKMPGFGLPLVVHPCQVVPGCNRTDGHDHEPIGPFTMTNEGVSACGVVGCDEPQSHTHLVNGRVIIAGERDPAPRATGTESFTAAVQQLDSVASAVPVAADRGSCPVVGCRIDGPHDHGDSGPAKQEPR